MAVPSCRQKLSLSLRLSAHSFPLAFLLSFCLFPTVIAARDNWTELNVGPFYVDTNGHGAAVREALTQLEQVRWVLGGLLEEKDLRSTWPIRVMLTDDAPASCSFAGSKEQLSSSNDLSLVPQHESLRAAAFPPPPVLHSQYLLVCRPGARLPLGEIAGILLDSNTPLLPPEIETGLRSLFDTLEARGSRVSWGTAPPHPDLAWARMQLFATKFEYSASFHILLAALKNGSTVRAAEQNAFGQPSDALEKEAAARLAQGNWPATATSGRPLDPKRDFGEHALDATAGAVYLADAQVTTNLKAAQQAYKAASEADGPAASLGYEGLAQLAQFQNNNPNDFLDGAIRAGSHSAPVYLASATDLPPEQAISLLKKANLYNPRWAEPLLEQSLLAEDPKEKEELLKKAIVLNRREPQYWIQLAKLQTEIGQAAGAKGSWLRAEDAAPTSAMRDQIQKQAQDSEEHRLDAAEKAQNQDRNSTFYADQHAQKRQSDRILAAEKKANSSLAAQAGGSPATSEAVPWSDLVPQKKLDGNIVRVDCLGSNARLTVKDRSGATIPLLLKNASEAGLACGDQQPPRRVSLTYAAEADERFSTAGTISSLNLWRTR